MPLVLGTGAIALWAGSGDEAGSDIPDQPNIVVVMTDDQRPDTLRFMPEVRALRGTVYRRHYMAQPICCPARATFLTGQYPHRHGVKTNNVKRDLGLGKLHQLESRALPVWLKDAGYVTGFAGKYMNKYGWDDPYVPAGWDEWSARDERGFTAVDARHYDGTGVRRTRGHDTQVLSRFATDFIDRHAEGSDPFFLTVMPIAPHTAYRRGARPDRPVPFPLGKHRGAFRGAKAPGSRARRAPLRARAGFMDRKDPVPDRRADRYWRRHLEALKGVDEMIGKIRSTLVAAGEWRNTVVIFTSDNGYMLGEHRLWGKDILYEESARVPLVVSGPGFRRGPTDKLTTDLDIPRTIARLARAEPRLEPDGRPLWAKPRKRLLLAGEKHNGRAGSRAVITPKLSFIDWRHWGRELYNLRRDPNQLRPLGGRPALKRKLARAMRRMSRD